MNLSLLTGALLLLASVAPAFSQARVVFRCKDPGRYELFFPGQADHYCWDKVLYTRDSAPPEIRAYFEERAQKARAANDRYQSEFRARWEARRAAEQAAAGAPAVRRRAAVAAPVPVAAPSPRREVALELVKEITVGTSRSDVIAKLGQPHGRISGSEESFRYGTAGGGVARIKLSEGKVTAVVLPQE